MIIVYPKNNHETFEKSTFVIGQIPHGYAATINGEYVKTSPSGYFSHLLPLKIGDNIVNIQKFNPNGSTNDYQMTIQRKGHLTPLQDLSAPELIEPYLFPATDYAVTQGVPVTLAVLAPPDAAIICQIHPIGQSLVMLPTDMVLTNQTHQFGRPYQSQMPYPEGQWYTAVLDTTGFPTDDPLTLSYVFEHQNLTYSQQAKGLLTVWSAPRYAVTTIPETITRTSPNYGSRLTPLIQGTQLQLTAQQEDWYRCRPGNYWVDIGAVDVHQSPPSLDAARLDSIHIDVSDGGEITFQLYINECIPIDVQLSQFQLKLNLQSTLSYCDVIRFDNQANECGFEDLSWRQDTTDGMPCVHLEFNFVSELLGYHYSYDRTEGQLLLKVSTKKGLVRHLQQGNPLVVVVDAGHGGAEKGAVAPDGSSEKDLNLAMVIALQEQLQNENAIQFHITRDSDSDVSLTERTQFAKQCGAHLFLSIHHNALPDGRDPAQESGLSTYYYNTFSKPVAHFIQSTLLQHTQLHDYGILYDSLHICRLTQCPSLLLELGFLTNPDDAEKCLDPRHRQQMVNALAIAIRRYRLWLLGMTS